MLAKQDWLSEISVWVFVVAPADSRKNASLSVGARCLCRSADVGEGGLRLQSGIHGWGLFARKAMKADSMVIEYRGDVLRRTAADAREKRYQAAGKDCYLFTVQDDFVIDATMRGGIGRFTVRSSSSNSSCNRLEKCPFCSDVSLCPACSRAAVRALAVAEYY